jgi:hypothetical protein
MKNKFRTSDGYTLHWSEATAEWLDNPLPAFADIVFQADRDGWPIDSEEQRLEGSYID